MDNDTVFFTIFIIFCGAAVLSTLALYTRQALLVAYIIVGCILGPWGLGVVSDPSLVSQIGEIGIIFLLFLLGLHLHPQNLLNMLKKVTWVALVSSVVLILVGYGIGLLFGFTQVESWIVGAALMFSSTIIGLKLLPTTILHHQHTGEVVISVLLFQDLIAIIILLLINGASSGGISMREFSMIFLAFPALLATAFLFERFILMKLLARFDRFQEYVFLLSVAWCLGMAELAHFLGLSEEVGAFIAGITIAASPIALYIAESLKPLRDFFLVMFFFSIGASFDIQYLPQVIVPALILGSILLISKPILYGVVFQWAGESKKIAWEVGWRLGQASEFSLLVAYLAMQTELITPRGSYLIQATTIFTFIISSYIVILCYPTPIATSDRLRRD